MKARINNPMLSVPGALEAFQAFAHSAEGLGVSEETIGLVQLRTSQVNGCHVCVSLHCGILRKVGAVDAHIDAVANWRESGEFTPAERAALALAEEVTRLADRPDAVPDEVWDEAARYYDERGLSALLIGIAATSVANMMNVAVRQQPVSNEQIAKLAAQGVRVG